MNNTVEEWFVFLSSATSDLDHARKAATEATDAYSPFVQYCLLRDSVVAYFRPFKRAKAVHSGVVRLPVSWVPAVFSSFHEELEGYRDQAYAHSDIRERQPRLFNMGSNEAPAFAISMKVPDKKPLHIHRATMIAMYSGVYERVASELATLRKALSAQVLREHGPSFITLPE